VQLGAVTDGLRFQWTPPATINDPSLLNPIAIPLTTTTYQIRANIGSCSATDNVTIRLVPYPGSNAGNDTTICYNTFAQLNGRITGNSFSWSPRNTLNNPNILNPIATPFRTTAYVLSCFDTLGCPKPGRDTILVTMLPKINAFAGNDTAVIVGQPLQLLAAGGDIYLWTPATGLNAVNIPDPVAFFSAEIDSVRYRVFVSEGKCVDSAFIKISIFKTNPQIFVPTAFTPNGDGRNDRVRPIAVGIKNIEYFRVYNRWGQMVFATTINGVGWDGKINGKPQGTNSYVWLVKAIDYLHRPYFQKGTVTLIR
jgi:gliding motility-associated-like protein